MAAPTVGAAGTYRQGTTGSPAFAAPASVVANSVVVLQFYLDGAATISALPTGFAHAPGSPVRVGAGVGGEHSLNVLWHRASGSEAGPYTPTLSGSVYSNGRTFRVDGCVTTGDPWDTNSGAGAAAATDITNGTVTPAVSMTTQAADELLWFAATNWAGGAWTPPTAGGTWTEQMDTGDANETTDTKSQAVAGATGSVTATCVGSNKRAAWIGSLLSTAAGGTTYNQSVSGGVTPAAVLVRSTAKLPAGSLTPSGVLARQAGKRPAGSVTPTGALVRQAAKRPAGTLTPAGALARQTSKAFAGTVTPSGALATLKAALRSFAGAIIPTGALTRRTAKTLVGTIAPTGSIRRLIAKAFAGTLTAAGAVTKLTAKRLLGTLAPAGAVATSTGPPAPQRDLQLTVGPPELRWTTGTPATSWRASEPHLKWRASTPEV